MMEENAVASTDVEDMYVIYEMLKHHELKSVRLPCSLIHKMLPFD